MTRNSYRLRVSIAIALLACGLLVLLLGERKIDRVGESSGASGASAFIRVSNASSPSTDSDRRRLSLSLPNGGCEITWPKQPPPGIPITYAASYPGCGARMTWNLVEALTGMWTGDDWNNNGRGKDVITVKTHYPQSNGILVDFDHEILRAFVIIRNPMKSIPSFFNHIYEMRNHLPVHSERAPVEEWVKWRNAYLQIEIDEYKKFIIYWMDRYTPENRLFLTYEGLTDDLIGAEVTKGLNEFLGQAPGVTAIDRESVPCVWRAVVKNQPPPQQAAQIERLQAQAVNKAGTASGQVPGAQLQPQQPQQPAMPASYGASPKLNPIQQTVSNPMYAGRNGGAPPKSAYPQSQEYPQAGQTSYSQLPPQSYTQLTQQQPGLRRRLDPGHHNSKRAGPDQPRPYTPEQLDSMMNMLLEVAERYSDDIRLSHIMMGYYEKIRDARIKLDPDNAGSVVMPRNGLY